jgi:hypothetical protein
MPLPAAIRGSERFGGRSDNASPRIERARGFVDARGLFFLLATQRSGSRATCTVHPFQAHGRSVEPETLLRSLLNVPLGK